MQIHEYLDLDIENRTISCTACGERICDAEQNYKEHCVLTARPIDEVSPAFLPPEKVLPGAEDIEFRQFCCPDCATLLDSEISLVDEPILHDFEIDVDALAPE